jgi:predicted nucleotidyltransferase
VGRREVGGFDAVDPRYEELYDRACAVFAADDRVERVELHGSIATGTADAWSDLDLKVIVPDALHKAVVDDWEQWMDAIAPMVLRDRPIAPFIVNAITADGLVFDVSVWTSSMPGFAGRDGLAVGFLSSQRFHDYPAAVAYAVAESLRGTAGALIKLLKRGHHVFHFSGVGHTFGLLQTVLLAEVEAPIDSRRPWANLPPEQVAVLAALPPVAPSYDSLLEFELAVSRQVITRGRALLAHYGLEWPTALEAVAARNLREHLGVTVDWLHQ